MAITYQTGVGNDSDTNSVAPQRFKWFKVACTTGTETLPTQGLSLLGTKGMVIKVRSAAGNFTAGTLQAYISDPQTGSFDRANDLDLIVVAGQAAQGFTGFLVTSPFGNIVYLPSGLGVACDVWVLAAY